MKKLLGLLAVFIAISGFVFAAPATYNQRAQDHLELLNQYRAERGLPHLVWDDELAECIEDYLHLQINQGFHGHTGPGGTNPTTRCGNARLIGIGENLIYTTKYFPTAQRALELRDASPSHKENLVHPNYYYVGIAAVWDPVKQQSRRGQVFAHKEPTNLSFNLTTSGEEQQNNSLPNAVKINITKAESVWNGGKKYLRVYLTLDWDVDRGKMSSQLGIIAQRLWNILNQ